MPRIFISYKRVDKDKIFKIKDQIESALGEKCWIDLDGIESDAQFKNVIIKAIIDCEVFLFMYSQAHSKIENFERDWTIRELNFAEKKDKRIVFINIDGTPLIDEFEFDFGSKQQIDGQSEESLHRLINDLRKWKEIIQQDSSNIISSNLHDKTIDVRTVLSWSEISQEQQNFSGNLDDLFDEAYNMWRDNESKEAFKRFAYLVSKDYSKALGYLGLCYEYGNGIEKHEQKMITCYQAAINRKEYLGVFRLGKYFYHRGMYGEAMFCYMKSINEGWASDDAYYQVGLLYEGGLGVPRDLNKSLEMYRRAYMMNPHSEYKLKLEQFGVLNTPDEFSLELPESVKKLSYLKLFDLAEEYKDNNVPLSYNYYMLASKKGHVVGAIKVLQLENIYGLRIEKGTKEQLIHLIDSSESFVNENPSYAFQCGYYFQNERRDIAMSKILYNIGAENGDRDCLWKLGELASFDGDYLSAFDFYLESAKKGQGMSMYAVAKLYESGMGITKDITKAIKWYQRCSQSLFASATDARKALQRIQETSM